MAYLIIKHAMNYCTTQQVMETFNTISPASVLSVVEKLHTNKYGYKSKSFRIYLSTVSNSEGMFIILDRIQREGFAAIIYTNTWDSKLRRNVNRYWKVYMPTEPFRPRIMTEEEQSKLGNIGNLEKPTYDDTYDDMPPLVSSDEQTKLYETIYDDMQPLEPPPYPPPLVREDTSSSDYMFGHLSYSDQEQYIRNLSHIFNNLEEVEMLENLD